MTWREDRNDYSDYSNNYLRDHYYNELTKTQDENKVLTRKLKFYMDAEDKIKNEKERKKKEVFSKKKLFLNQVNNSLENEDYETAISMALSGNADSSLYLSLLTDELEWKYDKKTNKPISSIKDPEALNQFLFKLYELLIPERTEDYARRSSVAICAIGDMIDELKKSNHESKDEEENDKIKRLQRRKITLCVKSSICIGMKDYIFADQADLCKVLLSPDNRGIASFKEGVNFDETVAELAEKLGENQIAIEQLQKERDDLKNQLQKLTAYNQTISDESPENLRKIILNQQKEFQDANRKREEAFKDQERLLTVRTKYIDEQEKVILDLRNEVTDWKGYYEMRKQDVKNLNDIIKGYETTIETQQVALDNYEKEREVNEQKLVNQENEINTIKENVYKMGVNNKQLRKDQDELQKVIQEKNETISMQQKTIVDLKEDFIKKARDLLQSIQDDIVDDKKEWDIGCIFGGERFTLFYGDGKQKKDITVTSSAGKILDTIETFVTNKKSTAEDVISCLSKIKKISNSGINTNWFYRFFFGQAASSRQRYDHYKTLVNDFLEKNLDSASDNKINL